MRKLATCLLFTPLFLGGCLEPTTPQAVIDSEPKASQGVIWLQDYPAVVHFDASKSTGEILSYQWTVLDEDEQVLATAHEEQFLYKFNYGRYVVRLEITTFELETDEAQVEVVANKPPVAVISYAPREAVVGEEVTFRADGSDDEDGRIVEYLWDFGDGDRTSTDEPEVTHTYREDDLPEGVTRKYFTVTLAVIDDLGGVSEPSDHQILIVGWCCGGR